MRAPRISLALIRATILGPAFAQTSGYHPRQLAPNARLPYDAGRSSDVKGGGVGRTSTGAAALCAGGGEPSRADRGVVSLRQRSEEHTSELQSLRHLVCRLLLEKKKKKKTSN